MLNSIIHPLVIKKAEELIEEFNQQIDFLFIDGTLIPHNVVIETCKRGNTNSLKLLNELSDVLKNTLKLCFENNITLVGTVPNSYETIFQKIINFGLDNDENKTRLNDIKLLNALLSSGDTTCLIQRDSKRKPLPLLQQTWEFYLRKENSIVKYEFIEKRSKDPMETFEILAPLIYNTSRPDFNSNPVRNKFPIYNGFTHQKHFNPYIYKPLHLIWACEYARARIKLIESLLDDMIKKLILELPRQLSFMKFQNIPEGLIG